MNAAVLNHQVERQLESLRCEFADVSASQVTAIGEAYLGELCADARINDFIPVLVYRHTREQLLRCSPGDLSRSA